MINYQMDTNSIRIGTIAAMWSIFNASYHEPKMFFNVIPNMFDNWNSIPIEDVDL